MLVRMPLALAAMAALFASASALDVVGEPVTDDLDVTSPGNKFTRREPAETSPTKGPLTFDHCDLGLNMRQVTA